MRVLLCLAVFATVASAQKAPESDWLLPNLGMRLSVEVSNPTGSAVTTLASIPVSKARAAAPEFPGRLAFALLLNDAGGDRPATFLPSQIEDLDADGVPDTFLFPVTLTPGAKGRVDVYYTSKFTDAVTYPKHVGAKHSYGYNREVAALESETMGYRTYGGFFLDFMGRSAGRMGLQNDMAGYVSIHRDLGAGRDVFHIGRTLGLGGIFLRRDGTVYQPPMNVPTYAHKPSPEAVPHYRVISDGPLRASIETTLDRWDVGGGDAVRLRAIYTIESGTSHVQCRVEVVPLQIAAGHEYEVGTGLRTVEGGAVNNRPGTLLVTGQQDRRDGNIGIGLYYDPSAFAAPAPVATADGNNHGVVLGQRLVAGRAVSASYSVVGVWSGSGTADLMGALERVAPQAAARVETGAYRFSVTPRPEKEEAEAQ